MNGKHSYFHLQQWKMNEREHDCPSRTLFLIDVLLVGGLVGRRLDVCVLDGVYLLLHGYVHRGLVFAHVHVSPVALTSKRHIAGGNA